VVVFLDEWIKPSKINIYSTIDTMEEPVEKKINKRYTKPKNTSAMKAYYNKPENQKNLRGRIQKYTEMIEDTQKKIDELRQYVNDKMDE